MSTFIDKKQRVFRTRSEEVLQRLTKKRSDGRLKAFNSCTDNRAWCLDNNERRRHILELLKSYETTVGNYIPLETLFGVLLGVADQERENMLEEALDSLHDVDDVVRDNDSLKDQLGEAEKKKAELEAQKKELSSLATYLSRAGGDLKKENAALKSEIERLKKKLDELQIELSGSKDKIPPVEETDVKPDEQDTELETKEGDDDKSISSRTAGPQGKVKKTEGSQGRGKRTEGFQGDGDPVQLKKERDNLRAELNHLMSVEQELKAAEQRITELLCEIENLQRCLEKVECDAMQMFQIIEQQQAKINSVQFLECKLKDITKQRDYLRMQLECKQSSNSFKNNESQNRQIEEEKNSLMYKLQMLEGEMRAKDEEYCTLSKKMMKQNECIASLRNMLAAVDLKIVDSKTSVLTQADSSPSELYSKDMDEVQCKLVELQTKVTQQTSIIMSQRQCLLEQHKYILEQEQIRSSIQNRIRDQSRKQAELVYERNLLRNEIMFLTARLKTYLGKIQLLEKSIEQFFDSTKNASYEKDGDCFKKRSNNINKNQSSMNILINSHSSPLPRSYNQTCNACTTKDQNEDFNRDFIPNEAFNPVLNQNENFNRCHNQKENLKRGANQNVTFNSSRNQNTSREYHNQYSPNRLTGMGQLSNPNIVDDHFKPYETSKSSSSEMCFQFDNVNSVGGYMNPNLDIVNSSRSLPTPFDNFDGNDLYDNQSQSMCYPQASEPFSYSIKDSRKNSSYGGLDERPTNMFSNNNYKCSMQGNNIFQCHRPKETHNSGSCPEIDEW